MCVGVGAGVSYRCGDVCVEGGDPGGGVAPVGAGGGAWALAGLGAAAEDPAAVLLAAVGLDEEMGVEVAGEVERKVVVYWQQGVTVV